MWDHNILDVNLAVLRNPIESWGTCWYTGGDGYQRDTRQAMKHEQQMQNYNKQNYYTRLYDFTYYRVDKDPFSDIQELFGDHCIAPSENTETRGPHPLKLAIKAKDKEACIEITNKKWWEHLQMQTEVYHNFYRKHGYDLWWY